MADKVTKKTRVHPAYILVPLTALILGAYLVWTFIQPATVSTSEGLDILKSKTIESAVINDSTQQVSVTLTKDWTHKSTGIGDSDKNLGRNIVFTYARIQSEHIIAAVQEAQPTKGWNASFPRQGFLSSLLQLVLPLVLVMGGLLWFMNTRISSSNMFGGVGKINAKEFNQENPDITFDDVAGEDEAVEELEEIREFLASPDKFRKLGAKIPRGVLLYGPPGTGKTLLAKAVAGEAGVPFFSISGSEFLELYVGVGASRVRDLFVKARKAAPAIVFIDEIDAVGRHRGSGHGGGNDEREQTLNQLLVELDGFDDRANVILIAATNRPDILDPALLRPGRFDRQISVDAPDLKGREAILKVHAKGKPLASDIDLFAIAKRTPGFTGADLANVLNEAALLTARSNADLIDDRAVDEAIDRVIAGPQKRTRVMNDHDKEVTAYHEGGHALAAAALNYTDPVTKVTILPRGRALGYTMVMPTEDRYSKTRNQMLDDLVYAMGGRVAEELVFRDPSSGAANDIQNATKTAHAMVTQYGMSSRIGTVKLGGEDSQAFGISGPNAASRGYSDEMAFIVDEEVRTLMDAAIREAWEILTKNRAILDTLAQRLLEEETLDEAALAKIFENVIKQPKREIWNYGADGAVEGAQFGAPISEHAHSAQSTEESQ